MRNLEWDIIPHQPQGGPQDRFLRKDASLETPVLLEFVTRIAIPISQLLNDKPNCNLSTVFQGSVRVLGLFRDNK